MSQATDYVLSNQSGASFRAELNTILAAIVSSNSNATEPATMYPFMLWADTSSGLLKIRNAANSAWIEVGTLASANLGLAKAGVLASSGITGAAASGANSDITSLTGITTPLSESQGGTGTKVGVSGFKNKIIGGDFTTNPWQRGTSFAAVVAGAVTADRWAYSKLGTAVHTLTKSADAPTASQAGIYTGFSLGLAVTTAQITLAAGDYILMEQKVEGLNAAAFGFGQAGARNITLSFWVKGAKTGIHCVAFRNGAGNRSYIAEYSITAVNTWEKKTITIPVDVAGTWLYDNGAGLTLSWALAAGTTFQTTANTWTAGNFLATANQVNELDAVDNNFKIALVQLEAGSTATAFETRSFGQEEALCHRYYEFGGGAGNRNLFSGDVTAGASYRAITTFKVPKRASPTVNGTGSEAVGFGAAVAYEGIGVFGFRDNRVCATTTNGALYTSDWTASAEL